MTDVAELAEVLQRAKATHKTGNFSEAIPLYRQVLAEVPDSVEAEHGLGLALSLSGDPTGGEVHLRSVLQAHPDLAHVHNSLALALRAQNRFAEAAESFEEALRLRLGYRIALSNLAKIRGEQGRNEEAAQLSAQALKAGDIKYRELPEPHSQPASAAAVRAGGGTTHRSSRCPSRSRRPASATGTTRPLAEQTRRRHRPAHQSDRT